MACLDGNEEPNRRVSLTILSCGARIRRHHHISLRCCTSPAPRPAQLGAHGNCGVAAEPQLARVGRLKCHYAYIRALTGQTQKSLVRSFASCTRDRSASRLVIAPPQGAPRLRDRIHLAPQCGWGRLTIQGNWRAATAARRENERARHVRVYRRVRRLHSLRASSHKRARPTSLDQSLNCDR